MERLAELGVTQGCSSQPARFCPTDTVSRAQMAAFIDRAFKLADGGPAGFVDTAGVFSADAIDRLYHAGVSRGCAASPLRFCPERSLTRAQMAALLRRARPVSTDAQVRDAAPHVGFSQEPPSTTSADLAVYLCGPPDSFTAAELRDEVDKLSAEITTFYRRESNGQSRITFSEGGIVSPDEASDASSWSREFIDDWIDDSADGHKGRGPCYDEVAAIGGSSPFAILADVGSKMTHGYGIPMDQAAREQLELPDLTGHITVLTRSAYDAAGRDASTTYGWLVAHEIGHLLSLCHTFAGDNPGQGDDFCESAQGTDPRVWDNCTPANRCNGDSDQWHLAASIMSYLSRGAYPDLSDSYVACSQKLWLGWIDDCSEPDAPKPPDAPNRPGLIVGDGQITVEWVPPNDNGSSITQFEIAQRRSGFGIHQWSETYASGSATRATITGLDNNTQYEIRIRAHNAAGLGDWSPLAKVVTLQPPDAPNRPGLIVGDGQITVEWVPPNDNGSSITQFEIAQRRSGFGIHQWSETYASGSATRATITGLDNNTQYEIRIRAHNAAGPGDWSPLAIIVIPPDRQPPDAPHPPVLDPGDGQITVEWVPPNDNGSPITGYNVDIQPAGGSWTTYGPFTSTRRTVTGLANGVEHAVEVQAINAAGPGAWSDSSFATPRTTAPPPQSNPTLSVSRGGTGVAGGCTANSGCRWVHGSGTGWTPGAQYWIRCGTFVDTSRNIPVTYSARFVDSNGNISWGDRICLSNFSHSVEVWTNADGTRTANVAAPNNPPPPPPQSNPTLSVSRGGTGVAGGCTANSGCRWVHGSGTGWTPGAQYWIRCGTFVDTSRNIPVTYSARFVDSNGNISWGDRICLSNFSHSVEVWTNADGTRTANVAAP